jgi:V-type H+-transporting ATPase subunit a
MSFGMFLQCFNHIHFGHKSHIIAEFVPQILFFWSIFGYLCVLIIMKWLMYFPNPSEAPGLLNTLIYMFLSPGSVAQPLYRGQAVVQVLLLLVAFISIPWMLFAKPYLELQHHRRTTLAGYAPADQPQVLIEEGGENAGHDGHEHGDGHEQVFIINGRGLISLMLWSIK